MPGIIWPNTEEPALIPCRDESERELKPGDMLGIRIARGTEPPDLPFADTEEIVPVLAFSLASLEVSG